MFQLKIKSVPVLCSKFFAPADREGVLGAIPEATERVVFIDTPATAEMVKTIETLLGRKVEVLVRDHHDVEGIPTTPRDWEIRTAANRIRELLGDSAVISTRRVDPACSTLIREGEFGHGGTVIVADPDPDGLTAAMKACGVTYSELDADAAVLDGPRTQQTAERLSVLAFLLVRGMSTLPAFDKARPEVSELAKAKLFGDFVAVVSGDLDARTRLEKGVEAYEAGVKNARVLAQTAVEVAKGVMLVDTAGKPRYDLTTLGNEMEARAIGACLVTVVRKDNGPIAGKHGGIQVSLAVVTSFKEQVNLQTLLPDQFVSSPEAGVISNTTYLLHVSERVWNEIVLPALVAKFGG